MTAIEAREIADSIKKQEDLKYVMKAIETAARNGLYRCCYTPIGATNLVVTQLRDLGYHVTQSIITDAVYIDF